MRKQQQIWQDEHSSQSTLPAMANIEPASGVVQFTEWLAEHGLKPEGKAIDIGCGKGRNAVHLALLGYDVEAIDYIEPALKVAQELATRNKVADRIHFQVAEMDRPWPFDDNSFDVAVDSFSSIDIETKEGREVYRAEMLRTLKPGGYALVTVVSADDEWESEMIAASPGSEPNSTLWPESGKFQKDYDESELRDFYEDFEIIELKKISKKVTKLGRDGTATNFWLVLRKS